MRLFDGDHQLAGLVLGFLRGVEPLRLLHVHLVDPPGQHVGHQQVAEHACLLAELEHHIDAGIQMFHDAIDAIARAIAVAGAVCCPVSPSRPVYHEGKVLEPLQLAMQGDQRPGVGADLAGKSLDIGPFQAQQRAQPRILVDGIHQIG